MLLKPEIAQKIKAMGQNFNPDVLAKTRELCLDYHDQALIKSIPVVQDISYGEDERQQLDIYGVTNTSTLLPVVVFVHGGAFVAGDKRANDGAPFYQNVAAWAHKMGIACIAMTYRLAPQHTYPSGSEDIADAIEWIYKNGEQYGLDATQIILAGQSAGAVHVATYLATPELQKVQSGGVAAAMLLSGLYDMEKAADNPPKFAYFGKDSSLYAERSSLTGLIKNCHIPLLISTCEFDPADFQQQALLLLNALFERDKKLPSFVHQAGHNHLSYIFLLGGVADTLGQTLEDFVLNTLKNNKE